MAPSAACLSPICCIPFPASGPRRASFPSSLRRLPGFTARSSSGGGGTRPEPKPGNISDVRGSRRAVRFELGLYSVLVLVLSRS